LAGGICVESIHASRETSAGPRGGVAVPGKYGAKRCGIPVQADPISQFGPREVRQRAGSGSGKG